MLSLIEAAAGIVGLVVMLHASPLPLGRFTCGFCQSLWIAYPWFAYVGWRTGCEEGIVAGVASAWVGIGLTALVALLTAVFTPAFRDSNATV